MTTQATANQLGRLLWLLVAVVTGLNGCTGEPLEQAADNPAAVTAPAPAADLTRSALTRAFREQASRAARRTRADVTAELAERMENGRSRLLAGTDQHKRG